VINKLHFDFQNKNKAIIKMTGATDSSKRTVNSCKTQVMNRMLTRLSKAFKDAQLVDLTHPSTFWVSIDYYRRLEENLNNLRA